MLVTFPGAANNYNGMGSRSQRVKKCMSLLQTRWSGRSNMLPCIQLARLLASLLLEQCALPGYAQCPAVLAEQFLAISAPLQQTEQQGVLRR